jgi:hypothetical protein
MKSWSFGRSRSCGMGEINNYIVDFVDFRIGLGCSESNNHTHDRRALDATVGLKHCTGGSFGDEQRNIVRDTWH